MTEAVGGQQGRVRSVARELGLAARFPEIRTFMAQGIRDNRRSGGESTTLRPMVQLVTAAGPFAVTQPNTAVAWAGGSSQTVPWNVASTTANANSTIT